MQRPKNQKQNNTMKFITLLSPGFQTKLYLPAKFCTKARGDFSRKAEVVTLLGRWMIKSRKDEDEGGEFYFYGKEWAKLVKQHELEEEDVIVFEHVQGSFVFHASIYDASACEKLEFQPHGNVDDDVVPPHLQSPNPTFTRVLSAHSGGDYHTKSASRLYLPSKIWRDNRDFLQKNKVVLKMSSSHTKDWVANLTYYPGNYNRFAVAEGWYEFVRANGLKGGHCCQFEVVVDASPLGYPKRTALIIVTNKHLAST